LISSTLSIPDAHEPSSVKQKVYTLSFKHLQFGRSEKERRNQPQKAHKAHKKAIYVPYVLFVADFFFVLRPSEQ
jgi:hypothetical protein